MTLTVGSLFSGIGGFDLGLERAGFTIKWQVEIDPFCQRVLAKHWPGVQRYGDITAIDWREVESVAIVCGGFPCQPVSYAGKRLAQADERWLWPEFLRCIRVLRPHYVLIENVPGLVTAGLSDVLSGLAESRYDAQWDTVRASDFGLPHRRERLFLIAYPTGSRRLRLQIEIPNSKKSQPEGRWLRESSLRSLFTTMGFSPNSDDWRVHDEFPDWAYRIKALGNSVVPQIAEALGRMILEAHVTS